MRLSFVVLLFATYVLSCSVKDYGAVGDGKHNDTAALQKAIDECSNVEVPKGTFLSWPLSPRSNMTVTLDKDAKIILPDSPKDWPNSDDYPCFMHGTHLDTIKIQGKGTIDGRGTEWWEIRKKTPSAFAPNLICFSDSTNLIITGITVQNSPKHQLVLSCKHCEISNLTILAPSDSPNTDGIDIGGQDVHIHDNYIDVGDDNVAIEESKDESNPTSNIIVENNYFGHGHGASIGSIMHGYVEHITFKHNTFHGTTNGARIKTWQGGDGWVRNITFYDLTFEDVENPLLITQYYCPSSQHSGECKNETSAVKISDINFSNIKGTTTKENAGVFLCSDTVPCTSITMHDIDIKRSDGSDKFVCWKAYGQSANVNPPACLKS